MYFMSSLTKVKRPSKGLMGQLFCPGHLHFGNWRYVLCRDWSLSPLLEVPLYTWTSLDITQCEIDAKKHNLSKMYTENYPL